MYDDTDDETATLMECVLQHTAWLDVEEDEFALKKTLDSLEAQYSRVSESFSQLDGKMAQVQGKHRLQMEQLAFLAFATWQLERRTAMVHKGVLRLVDPAKTATWKLWVVLLLVAFVLSYPMLTERG